MLLSLLINVLLVFSLDHESCSIDEKSSCISSHLLPHGIEIESQELRVKRVMSQLHSFENDLDKYVHLMNLAERDKDLFYSTTLTKENVNEVLPLIYTPTVGEACQEYSNLWNRIPNFGVFLSYEDSSSKNRIKEHLKSIKREEPPQIIVVTDGSRILGLGDLGANGMGISVGKLMLYTLGGGFHPKHTLPITIDVGTDNEKLRNDEFYIGLRMDRLRDERFWKFLDDFLEAVKELLPMCVVQFEDFSNDVSFDILKKYRSQVLSFNDDIQGTGAVITAGWINAVKMSGIPIMEHRILFYGAGSAAVGVADQMKAYIRQNMDIEEEKIKTLFYMMDSKGLLSGDRDLAKLAAHKLEYVRKDIILKDDEKWDLYDTVELVKPTILIGLSKQPQAFDKRIIQKLLEYSDTPIIMALSNPTSKSECSSIDAYENTDGKAIFLSGSKFPSWKNPRTQEWSHPGQGNNLYIFPGLGLGCYLSQPREITDDLIMVAAKALSEMTTEQQMQSGNMYPGLEQIREISKEIAEKVASFVVDEGESKVYRKGEQVDFKSLIEQFVYHPLK